MKFITDSASPDEAETFMAGNSGNLGRTGSGKGKKAPSTKGGSARKKKTDPDKKEEDKLPSYMLPEAKIQACRIIMRVARKPEICRTLHDSEVERALVALVSNEDAGVRGASGQAIATIAENRMCQETFIKLGALEPLLRLIRSENRTLKCAGTLALASLTNEHADACKYVSSSSFGVEAIIGCLGLPEPEVGALLEATLACLTNLAMIEECRQKIISAGGVKALVPALTSQSVLLQTLLLV
ncbi:unnamed protein product [Protopolystoma xenopodis]|uniref:Armadillo repeat-containing domain-containing protein n=1 Tax=Protopolystoma xenopodis TaxID=117903 RepID=A0A3S4ZW08_9PLAT|nr:unnamed protein product [Protopolystoma xenopodis]